MKIHWKTAFIKTIVWLAAEIVLNLMGVDSLADYSEFIYEHQLAALSHLHQPAIIEPVIKRVKWSFSSKVLC